MEAQKKVKNFGEIRTPHRDLFVKFSCDSVFCPDYNNKKNLSPDFCFYRTGIEKK
ncbi:MAG: hypothetical protein BWX89_01032 [candidate division TA06 bacterium ADurb.Bin131]|jgi:hypothetical protein|uniref:Uncharacterized protein n=1 Tax=candidate division TA06 bacterium ADurb.Bin131 TaxID=1852827 RepID=A0A1V6C8R4_UNCT6|nr:MAG: hypothetical protein BWX89_01032 [candidate division TA06 bacterium ADurb.Bin131]